MATRGARRKAMSTETRVFLLEDDLDDFDDRMVALLAQVDRQIEEFRRAAAKNTAVLVGILVSVATAAILLAVNLAVAR